MDDELLDQKFALVDDCYQHLLQRVVAIEGDHAERKDDSQHADGMRVNWIVVALFVFELLQGLVTFLWMVRHG